MLRGGDMQLKQNLGHCVYLQNFEPILLLIINQREILMPIVGLGE